MQYPVGSILNSITPMSDWEVVAALLCGAFMDKLQVTLTLQSGSILSSIELVEFQRNEKRTRRVRQGGWGAIGQ